MYKTILITVFATVIVFALSMKLFFASILSGFGYAITTVDNLNSLYESRQIMKNIKKHHKAKKVKASKTFVKRSGRKIAASAVAASTVGTIAVIGTVATLEISDYCNEKEDFINEENILYGKDQKFDYGVCFQEAKLDLEASLEEVKHKVSQSSSDMLKGAKTYSDETWSDINNYIKQAYMSGNEYSFELGGALYDWIYK